MNPTPAQQGVGVRLFNTSLEVVQSCGDDLDAAGCFTTVLVEQVALYAWYIWQHGCQRVEPEVFAEELSPAIQVAIDLVLAPVQAEQPLPLEQYDSARAQTLALVVSRFDGYAASAPLAIRSEYQRRVGEAGARGMLRVKLEIAESMLLEALDPVALAEHLILKKQGSSGLPPAAAP